MEVLVEFQLCFFRKQIRSLKGHICLNYVTSNKKSFKNNPHIAVIQNTN